MCCVDKFTSRLCCFAGAFRDAFEAVRLAEVMQNMIPMKKNSGSGFAFC